MTVIIKLLNLNIEGDLHLDTVIPLLQTEKPEVICLQEVFEKDLLLLEKTLGMKANFLATLRTLSKNKYRVSPRGNTGLAIFTNLKLKSVNYKFYQKSRGSIPPLLMPGKPNSPDRGLVIINVEKQNQNFQIAATHFNWSKKGESTKTQLKSLNRMLPLIDLNNIILCGDFNAPRGRKTWEIIASKLKDNIPSEVTTTLDGNIHRAGDLQLVVDGLFTSKNYRTSDVRVISGVSDHCAIVANIEHSTFDVENI
jgi:endonuclease/exonuclease/phosphatase family metal-dependent hydrolase